MLISGLTHVRVGSPPLSREALGPATRGESRRQRTLDHSVIEVNGKRLKVCEVYTSETCCGNGDADSPPVLLWKLRLARSRRRAERVALNKLSRKEGAGPQRPTAQRPAVVSIVPTLVGEDEVSDIILVAGIPFEPPGFISA